MKPLHSTTYLFAITGTSALDALITHLVAITLLLSGHYLLSSFAFSIDAAMRVITAPTLASKVAAMSETLRSRVSFALKCLILLFASAVILFSATSGVIVLFVLAKTASVLDGLFGAHLIYKLEADHDIALSASSAALNIVGRGATTIAPALSLAILHSGVLSGAIVAIACMLHGVAMWIAKDLFFGVKPEHAATHRQEVNSGDGLLSNPFTRWGLLFSLLSNLSLAGVTLLLMRYLQPHDASVLNEISALYFAFFVTQVVVLFYGNRAIPASTIRDSSAWLCVAGTLTVAVALSSGALRLAFCVLLGIAYGILLSSISKSLLPRIGRALYPSYSAWAQPIGRGASTAATLTIGAAMSRGIEPPMLLFCCGMSGLAAAATLFVTAPLRQT